MTWSCTNSYSSLSDHADHVLSLHDALPICAIFSVTGNNFLTAANAFEITRLSVEVGLLALALTPIIITAGIDLSVGSMIDRKSTRLNSSHRCISYDVFCLTKKTYRPNSCRY